MVHCVALGKNASRVWVDEVKNPSTELWKKYADIGNNRRCFGKFNCMANRSDYFYGRLILAPRSRSVAITLVRSRSSTNNLFRSRSVTNDLPGYDSSLIYT
ncbi:hypothetical protein WN944_018957 [Citrus x changshan-huyou]|uniref:Uncharacterized protein n=1 Tax=Citrus x changshan-huyou TaxID=2935761 RepID=A0AAP0M0R5_9ROSI